MTSTDFQFTMRVPCDARLLATVRDLTAHAARYAEITAPDAATIVEHVEVIAAGSVGADHGTHGALELCIVRTAGALEVRLTGPDAGAHPLPAHLSAPDALTVRWLQDGTRRACVIALHTP